MNDTASTPGRNDPCGCGSGEKFKRCCGGPTSKTTGAARPFPETLIDKMRQRAEEREQYGEVHPIISTEFKGLRIVAVGDVVHWSPTWKTVPDFFMHYFKFTLGKAWGTAELAKPLEDRHQILKWYDAWCALQAATSEQSEPDAQGRYESELDGPSRACVLLAYDLYVLHHHGTLQAEVVQRLKNPGEFQGARYELFVAATMVRAGFELVHEDQGDGSNKHPEFIATHKRTGEVVAVEAKSKHRPGLLGFASTGNDATDFGLRIRGLLRDAFNKKAEHPLIVFVEANVPPELASPLSTFDLLSRVNEAVEKADITTTPSGLYVGSAYAGILVTNTSDHYGEPGSPSRGEVLHAVWPISPRQTVADHSVLKDIVRAVQQYGSFPQDFPEED